MDALLFCWHCTDQKEYFLAGECMEGSLIARAYGLKAEGILHVDDLKKCFKCIRKRNNFLKTTVFSGT